MAPPEVVAIAGEFVTVRPATPEDIVPLHNIAVLTGWRYTRPRTSVATFRGVIENDDMTLVIEHKRTGRIVGVVSVYAAIWLWGTAHVAVALDPGYQRDVWPLEGVAIAFDYLFGRYDVFPPNVLRRMSLEATEESLRQWESFVGRCGRYEGTLEAFAGTTDDDAADLYLYAVFADDWFHSEPRAVWLRAITRRRKARTS